jgi:predicted nucleic acid-binding protein
MILLDTNVVSELMKLEPDSRVVRWVASHDALDLGTTAVTEAEIFHGVRLLPAGRRRAALEAAASTMFDLDFQGRVVPFGSHAAREYAAIAAARTRAGRPISQFDAQIAAIARSVRATIATRNTADYDSCGVPVVNPWTVEADRA